MTKGKRTHILLPFGLNWNKIEQITTRYNKVEQNETNEGILERPHSFIIKPCLFAVLSITSKNAIRTFYKALLVLLHL